MFFETIRRNASKFDGYHTDDNGEVWHNDDHIPEARTLAPGRAYYDACPERAAGRCGRIPASWSTEDMEIWISGCGRRRYCPRCRVGGGRNDRPRRPGRDETVFEVR
jgi:hypothetical protein